MLSGIQQNTLMDNDPLAHGYYVADLLVALAVVVLMLRARRTRPELARMLLLGTLIGLVWELPVFGLSACELSPEHLDGQAEGARGLARERSRQQPAHGQEGTIPHGVGEQEHHGGERERRGPLDDRGVGQGRSGAGHERGQDLQPRARIANRCPRTPSWCGSNTPYGFRRACNST